MFALGERKFLDNGQDAVLLRVGHGVEASSGSGHVLLRVIAATVAEPVKALSESVERAPRGALDVGVSGGGTVQVLNEIDLVRPLGQGTLSVLLRLRVDSLDDGVESLIGDGLLKQGSNLCTESVHVGVGQAKRRLSRSNLTAHGLSVTDLVGLLDLVERKVERVLADHANGGDGSLHSG